MATKKTRKGKKTEAAPIEEPTNGTNGGSEEGWGSVSPETLSAITMMRNRSENIISEIGRIELRKTRLIAQIEELDGAAARMLRQEAKALGIPDEVQWRMTPEGKTLPVSAEARA